MTHRARRPNPGRSTRKASTHQMAQLTTKQYDALERAIAEGARIAVMRRGTEYIVVPERLRIGGGGEAIEARNPTTGDRLVIRLDEIDSVEVVR